MKLSRSLVSVVAVGLSISMLAACGSGGKSSSAKPRTKNAALTTTTLQGTSVSTSNLPVPQSIGRVNMLGWPIVGSFNGCDVAFKDNSYYPCNLVSQAFGYFTFANSSQTQDFPALPPTDTPYNDFKIVPPANAVSLVLNFQLVEGTKYKGEIQLVPVSAITTTSATPTTSSIPVVAKCVLSYNPTTNQLSVCLPAFTITYQFGKLAPYGSPTPVGVQKTITVNGGSNVHNIRMAEGADVLTVNGTIVDNSYFNKTTLPIKNPQVFIATPLLRLPPPEVITRATVPYPTCRVSFLESQFSTCKEFREISYRYSDKTDRYLTPWIVGTSWDTMNGKYTKLAVLTTPPNGATKIIYRLNFYDGSWTEVGSLEFNAEGTMEMKDVPGYSHFATTTTSTTTTTTTTFAPKTCATRFYKGLIYWCKQAKSWNFKFIVNGNYGQVIYGRLDTTNRGNNIQFAHPNGASAVLMNVSFVDGTSFVNVKVPFNTVFYGTLK